MNIETLWMIVRRLPQRKTHNCVPLEKTILVLGRSTAELTRLVVKHPDMFSFLVSVKDWSSLMGKDSLLDYDSYKQKIRHLGQSHFTSPSEILMSTEALNTTEPRADSMARRAAAEIGELVARSYLVEDTSPDGIIDTGNLRFLFSVLCKARHGFKPEAQTKREFLDSFLYTAHQMGILLEKVKDTSIKHIRGGRIDLSRLESSIAKRLIDLELRQSLDSEWRARGLKRWSLETSDGKIFSKRVKIKKYGSTNLKKIIERD